MKKKILMGLGIFFAIITAALIALVIYFWPFIQSLNPSLLTYSNVKALYMGLTMTDEQKDARLKEIDDKLSEEIKQYVSVEIRDFTEEEKQQIERGEKTKTEIIAQIITEATQKDNPTDVTTPEPPNPETTTPEIEVEPDNPNNPQGTIQTQPTQPTKPADTKPADTKPKAETADEIVARHISELYKHHNDFEGRVLALKERARAYMHAYKKANPDVSWRDAKLATMNNLMSEATKIENDCYAKVDAQIAALEKDLKAIKADTSVVSTVKTAAYNEMEVRKSKIVSEGQAELND